MNIQYLQSSASAFAAQSATAPAPAIAADAATASPQPAAASNPSGEGPLITSLKSALAAQGFSASGADADKPKFEKAMHHFTHAVFKAAHAMKQEDNASGAAGGTNTSDAISQLAAAAASGDAPPDLQAAFDALQQAQGSSASGSSLAQVLQGMAGSAAPVAGPGSVVDTTA
jgi:peptidoglycan hydrolase-like protein with peptidoglycan-binding domain